MVDESPKRLPVKTEDHLPRVGIALVEIVSAERFLEKKQEGNGPIEPACDKGMLFWPQKASTELLLQKLVLNFLTHSSNRAAFFCIFSVLLLMASEAT